MNYFTETEGVLDAIREADLDDAHIPSLECDDVVPKYRGRNARWWWEGQGYVIEVSVDRVLFMEGNLWNFPHAAAVVEAMRQGACFEPPAARAYRITAADVKQSQRWAKEGELAYQLNMTRPWTKADVGQYHVQLIDGNHRAAAAMILGEKTIPVYVGADYRKNIRKKDWL